MIGVSFDPATQQDPQQQPSGPNAGQPRGIQEAIKILSLRLPKVAGARAISPQALLTAPGAQGNPVDSVVNRIMARYFPTGAAPSAPVPMATPVGQPPQAQPPVSMSQLQQQRPSSAPRPSSWGDLGTVGRAPNVTVDVPLTPLPFTGDRPTGPRPDGDWIPPATIAPAPPLPSPWAPLYSYEEDRRPLEF